MRWLAFVSQSSFIRSLRQTIVVAALALAGGAGGCSSKSEPDDPFLSYWQCAEALVNALMSIESPADYSKDPLADGLRETAGATAPLARPRMRDVCLDLCEQLEALEAALAAVPPDEIKRLRQEHSALVQRVKARCAELQRKHSNEPVLVDDDLDDWERYRQALGLEI